MNDQCGVGCDRGEEHANHHVAKRESGVVLLESCLGGNGLVLEGLDRVHCIISL